MSIYKEHTPSQGDGLYLRLKDGDKVKLRIASEPVGTIYKEGDRLRYAWVVWNRETEKAQVFNAGISIYSQIADLVEEWGEPTEFDISIKRTGSGPLDTEYSVTPAKSSEDLTEAQKELCEAIDLPEAANGRWLSDIASDGVLPPAKEKVEEESGYDKAKSTARSIGRSDPPPSDEDMPSFPE